MSDVHYGRATDTIPHLYAGTIAPLVKAPNVGKDNSGGGEGMKMMVTISCVLVGIVVIFIGLLVLRRRRREQRLKRLRGELTGSEAQHGLI